jgi:NADH-quinone oxidoreductase subunit F
MEIVVHRSGGRYICGEVTAQLNALMGKRPNPQQPPPYPTEKGLWGMPTVLQNVETLANIPHIIRNGIEWYKNLAKTETGAGTKLFCVSGRVNKPGCYELPMGVRLSEIIEVHAGGMPLVPSTRLVYRVELPPVTCPRNSMTLKWILIQCGKLGTD